MFSDLKFTNEITTGQLVVAFSLTASVFGAYTTIRIDVELVKQQLVQQSADMNRVRGEIRDVVFEVREIRDRLPTRPPRNG